MVELKTEGYEPAQWVWSQRGARIRKFTGKISIPSDETKHRVCKVHGNMVKLHHETHPGRNDKGICVYNVFPCVFCTKNAERLLTILRSGRGERLHS
jgi:hypothetical protein